MNLKAIEDFVALALSRKEKVIITILMILGLQNI